MIGIVAETKGYLNFCVEKNILLIVEVVGVEDIDDAIERLKVTDVSFRFVIDMKKK